MTGRHLRRTFHSAFSHAIEGARSHPIAWLVAGAVVLGFPAYAAFSDTFLEPSESKPSNLQTGLDPVDAGIVSYVVPASSPWDSFPLAAGASCTPPQRDWLAEHGSERRTEWKISMVNSAAGGANTLAVSNFRLEGESLRATSSDSPAVLVDCPSAGLADWFVLSLDMARPGREGTATTSDDPNPRPLVLNLAPGERSEGQITLTSPAGFHGVVAVDTGTGAETARTSQIDVASMVGVRVRVLPFLSSESLQCELLTSDESSSNFFPCDGETIEGAAPGP